LVLCDWWKQNPDFGDEEGRKDKQAKVRGRIAETKREGKEEIAQQRSSSSLSLSSAALVATTGTREEREKKGEKGVGDFTSLNEPVLSLT